MSSPWTLADLRRQLALAPWEPYGLQLLGLHPMVLENPSIAHSWLTRARASLGADPGLLSNLGELCRQQGSFREAARNQRSALVLSPSLSAAMSNLGQVHVETREAQLGLPWLQRAIGLDPGSRAAAYNRVAALEQIGGTRLALDAYDDLVRRFPDFIEAEWNRALALLASGDYRRGWPAHEARFRHPRLAPGQVAAPMWDGQPLAGRTILLHAEQGLGDTIQFLRFVPRVAQAGGRVILAVQEPLVRLLAGFPGPEQVVPIGERLPAADVHAPLMSLPYLSGITDIDQVRFEPYLNADPEAVAAWRDRLPADGLKVGVVWRGGRQYEADEARSLNLETLGELGKVAGVTWIALQQGSGREYIPGSPLSFAAAPVLKDFAETASLIKALDLVVTVDTSTAHLAGALGHPVWVLLPKPADWRWLVDREDSPWYSSARLFRQHRTGSWREPVDDLRRALVELVQ